MGLIALWHVESSWLVIEPISPVLVGRILTTGPWGKSIGFSIFYYGNRMYDDPGGKQIMTHGKMWGKKLSMARAKIVRVRESLTRDKAQSLSSYARPWKTWWKLRNTLLESRQLMLGPVWRWREELGTFEHRFEHYVPGWVNRGQWLLPPSLEEHWWGLGC